MSDIMGYDVTKPFEYENGFHLTSSPSRMGKMLAHYELYKKVIDLPGHVFEFGVHKGNSLIRFATFRELLESTHSRKSSALIPLTAFQKQTMTKTTNLLILLSMKQENRFPRNNWVNVYPSKASPM